MPDHQLTDATTCKERSLAAVAVARHNPRLTLMWAVTFVLLVCSTIYTGETGNNFARWCIWLSFLTLFLTMARLARWIVSRTTQITALWHDDVRLPPRHRDTPANTPASVSTLRTGKTHRRG